MHGTTVKENIETRLLHRKINRLKVFTSIISLSSQNNNENITTVPRPNANLLSTELLIYVLTDNIHMLMADYKLDVLTLWSPCVLRVRWDCVLLKPNDIPNVRGEKRTRWRLDYIFRKNVIIYRPRKYCWCYQWEHRAQFIEKPSILREGGRDYYLCYSLRLRPIEKWNPEAET